MARQMARLSIRIDGRGTRFGPGKAALLAAVRDTGSIAAASRTLGMSYPRALKLATDMNAQFSGALIDKQHGGASRGGAQLTVLGEQVLACYEAICRQAIESNSDALETFAGLMAPQ